MPNALAGLPNAQLLVRVRQLVERGNAVEAELLAHLGEVDARSLYLEEGCSSMFAYVTGRSGTNRTASAMPMSSGMPRTSASRIQKRRR